MISITKSFGFDYGHRVLNHEGKCKHLHGHRGTALVTVAAPMLDKLGRVIDFGCLKTRIGGWIDENWDHNMILNEDDPLLELYDESDGSVEGELSRWQEFIDKLFAGKKPYIMPMGHNPTAEKISEELFFKTAPLLPEGILITKIDFYETPTSMATFIPDDVK